MSNGVVMAGVIEGIGNLGLDLAGLADGVLFSLLVVGAALFVGAKTRSMTAGLVTLIAGIILWAVAVNRENVRDGINEDIGDYFAAEVVEGAAGSAGRGEL
ncbi:hypothetical protein [Streptomyces xiamenensis]|uniref:hypothetical protein n=1 Tax=Streptomyces xiamenensis TaxID=408015 RepID=UPI0035DB8E4F